MHVSYVEGTYTVIWVNVYVVQVVNDLRLRCYCTFYVMFKTFEVRMAGLYARASVQFTIGLLLIVYFYSNTHCWSLWIRVVFFSC
jgi:hypothetical protein